MPPPPLALDRRLELAKWVALATMVVEHFGRLVHHAGMPALWCIGRIAFPLFVWLIAVRIARRPDLSWQYTGRLAVWAVISQPAYYLAFQHDWTSLSILPTLLAGVLATIALEKPMKRAPVAALVALLLAGVPLAFVPHGPIDGGPLGILVMPILVLLARRSLVLSALCCGPLFVLFNMAMIKYDPSLFFLGSSAIGATAVALMALRLPTRLPRLPGWMFYAFYPAHMIVLSMMGRSIGVRPW